MKRITALEALVEPCPAPGPLSTTRTENPALAAKLQGWGARAPVALVYGERDAIAWPEVEARFAALRSVQLVLYTHRLG